MSLLFYTASKKTMKYEGYVLNDYKILKSIFKNKLNYFSLKNFFFKEKKVIYIWWVLRSFHVTLLSKLFNKKVILVVGGNEVYLFNKKKLKKLSIDTKFIFIKKYLFLLSLHLCDEIFCVSDLIKKNIPKSIEKQKIKVFYNSIDTNIFTINKNIKKKYILAICTFDKYSLRIKNIFNLLEAFKKFSKINKKIKLLIIGKSGNQIKKVTDLVVYLGLNERVNIKLDVDNKNIKKYYQESFLYYNVSLTETFGLSIGESMACGTPCLTSDRGSIRKIYGKSVIYSKLDSGSIYLAFKNFFNSSSNNKKKLRDFILNNYSNSIKTKKFNIFFKRYL